MSNQRIVVVGSSLAGLRACETLRQDGFEGTITMVGAETEAPYDRPPLSKKLLSGEWDADRIRLRKPDDLAGLHLTMELGRAAVALDTANRTVTLADDTVLPYDGVVIATGSSPRRLPNQPSLDGVLELRTLADSMYLRERIADGTAHVVVIGAGFVGLEVAATARQKGCSVTVLEGAAAPLMRGLGAEMGVAAASVHARNGVDLRCGVQVKAIEGDAARVTSVRLADDTVVRADVVVVGVGVAPAVEWLGSSGLALRDGVVCDVHLNAGAPGVYAAGDCARWPNGVFFGHDDCEMRIEHWTNAAEQGAAAARNLLAWLRNAEQTPFESVPFFWSDQFDSRIQFIGRAHGGDDLHMVAGSPDGAFATLYSWEGRLRGVLGVSMPRMVMPLRALVAQRASIDDALTFLAR